ncbi:porin PorA family protein [Corynebacterium pseudodiphtheriticum]|uniref:Porin PorA family protein n=1 Tax=Corynebacterium pseudodiphtheriticum TaxID=37637 RepID=A0ABT7FUU5_9CORY|nr:porin PorA family protein [Corynebacterium pseudodiphtheriticum]MDC7110795.1 porin PorA family protein [Corynebacterium pseudodiphtheriticum]MDC7114562.1 porin PorA family protein [Corynebacterium pseudodiphtheriticum]MDK4289754.1 porin PorA family protein [Corynebacterium pseudodiphtheriticum]MDK4339638.1 porin PorA family protein [Corynebacterium pseudodiphtheriticum]MDK8684632.1 porin PorA family protein [Corynebacterium pseudodiphtheriticum]
MFRRVTLTVAAAALSLVVGAAAPPLVMAFHDSWPEGTTVHTRTEDAETQLLDTAGFAAATSSAGAGKPLPRPADCPEATPTFSCYISTTTTHVDSEITLLRTTQDADDPARRSEITARHTLLANDGADGAGSSTSDDATSARPLGHADNDVTINRESAIGIPDPTSRVRFYDDGRNDNTDTPVVDTGLFARPGIYYAFEPDTQKRSYNFFDLFTQEPLPIDFADTIEQGEDEEGAEDGAVTAEFYEYRHTITAHPLQNSLLRAYSQPQDLLSPPTPVSALSPKILDEPAAQLFDAMELTGPATDFYTADELADERVTGDLSAADTVTMRPYYSVDRLVWVEPITGQIVNRDEHYEVFLAADGTPAQPAPERTVLSTHAKYDSASREEAQDLASKTVRVVERWEAIGFLTTALGIILLAAAVWMIWRHRHSQKRAHANHSGTDHPGTNPSVSNPSAS